MALRQRPGGVNANRPRQFLGSKYEDFQPQTENKEQEDAHILLVHLPGFMKEQIRITFLHSSQSIRAFGERPLGSGKWSRFNQSFPVPENCIVDKIHGNFHNGILTITMPKSIKLLVFPKEEPKPTSNQHQPPKSAKLQEAIPPKPPTSTTGKQDEQKGLEASSSKDEQSDKSKIADSAQPKSRKDHVEIPQKQADEKGFARFDQKVPEINGRDENAEKMKAKSPVNENENMSTETSGKEEDAEKLKEKSAVNVNQSENKSREKDKEPSIAHSNSSAKISEKEERVSGGGEVKSKDSAIVGKEKGIKDLKASAKQAVTSLKKRFNEEERQLLINMGAAVLVIVAIGAYAAYRFRSSANAGN